MGERNEQHFLEGWLKQSCEQYFGEFIDRKIVEIGEINEKSLSELSDDIANLILEMPEVENVKSKVASSISATTFHFSRSESRHPLNNMRSLEDLAGWVSTHQPPSQRIHGLEILLKAPMTDMIISNSWAHLQRALCEALCGDNRNIFDLVLKFHAKLLSSGNMDSIKEGFLSLVEGLMLYYLSHHTLQNLPTISSGISVSIPSHFRMVQITTTILSALTDMPKSWIRFGEKRVEEVIDNFVDLLAMHTHNDKSVGKEQDKDIVYPFQLISILDSEAKWCRCLMHAAFSRSILLRILARTPSLMRFIVNEVITWLEYQLKLSSGVVVKSEPCPAGNVPGNIVALTTVIHCLSIIGMLATSERGSALFPIKIHSEEDSITLYKIATTTLIFLSRNGKASAQGIQRYSSKVLHMFENTLVTLLTCRGARMLSGSCLDIVKIFLESRAVDTLILNKFCISVLNSLSASESTISWMLGRTERRIRASTHRSRSTLSSASSYCREYVLPHTSRHYLVQSSSPGRSSCIGKVVVECTISTLSNWESLIEVHEEDFVSVVQLLSMCHKMYSIPDGFTILESYLTRLIPLAKAPLLPFEGDFTFKSRVCEEHSFMILKRSAATFLLGVSTSPKGFLTIAEDNTLVTHLMCHYLDEPWSVWNNPQLKQLLQLSGFMPVDSTLTQQRNKLFRASLNELWAAEDSEVALLTGSERPWVEALNTFMSRLLSICSSSAVVKAMLVKDELFDHESSDDDTLVEGGQGANDPQTLRELLGSVHDDSAPACVSRVGLLTLHSLSYNLDIALELQEIPKFQQAESTTHAWDMLLLRSGNVAESRTSQDLFLQVCDPSAYDLRGSGGPSSPQTSHPRTARSRLQSDLQRFLQDTRFGLHDAMWLTHARRAYRSSSQCDIKVSVVLDLIDQILRSQPALISSSTTSWFCSSIASVDRSRHAVAIQMIVRYGYHHKVLGTGPSSQHCEQLALLLHEAGTGTFLKESQENGRFDWFVATVFLLSAGNLERSRVFLQKVSQLPSGFMLWVQRRTTSNMQSVAHLGHHLQALVAQHLPQAHHALQEAGVSWWFVTERLFEQALLPALQLSQIMHVLVLGALHPVEYLLYFRVALLAYLQPRLLSAAVSGCVDSLVNECPFSAFRVGDYLPFMDRMAKWNRLASSRERLSLNTL